MQNKLTSLYKRRNRLEKQFMYISSLNPETEQAHNYIENKLLLLDDKLNDIENQIFLKAN